MKPSLALLYPKTVQEARDWFFQHGIAVNEWARCHELSPQVVYSVLSGRTRGSRGQAHLAALALGLKKRLAEEPKKDDQNKSSNSEESAVIQN